MIITSTRADVCKMFFNLSPLIIVILMSVEGTREKTETKTVQILDLTNPTSWKGMSDFYMALDKNWKICVNCGIAGIGTAMHLEHHHLTKNSMHPAIIPSEYLITKLVVIDLGYVVDRDPTMVLTTEIALQWRELKEDHREPTLLVFKFGWKGTDDVLPQQKCFCKIPGISYDLAAYIVSNLTSVVGVGTDAPTLESVETREKTTNTVSNMLGKNGVYMIENINLKRKFPDHGCIAIAMPVKIRNFNYVPTRLTALCPYNNQKQVVLSLRDYTDHTHVKTRRMDLDVNLEELMD